MESERYQRGLEKFKEYQKVNESASGEIKDPLDEIAPDFRRWIIEFAYGDIYSRPNLDNKSRALVVISSIVTQGMEPQLATHIKRGMTAGLTREEVVESITQLIPYVGFPRVQNALMVAKRVFEELE